MNPQAIVAAFESAFQSPAALRNRQPLLDALQTRLPDAGTVLEVAAGALTHALALSTTHPQLRWLPSEVDQRILGEVSDYLRALSHLRRLPPNLHPPFHLDVNEQPWPVDQVEAVYTANLLHISPAASSVGLFRGAGRHLTNPSDASATRAGRLLVYGPFRIAGRFSSEGDARFDASLRARNPDWGIRDLETLIDEARREGLELTERHPMPANNWLLTFEAGSC